MGYITGTVLDISRSGMLASRTVPVAVMGTILLNGDMLPTNRTVPVAFPRIIVLMAVLSAAVLSTILFTILIVSFYHQHKTGIKH